MQTAPHWIAVARLLRPQGRHGELLADPLTDLPGVFTAGRSATLSAAANVSMSSPSTTIEDVWHPTGRNAGRLVLKLAGCNSISDAEQLAGRDLLIRSDDLPALEADTWFVSDLIGCTLFDGDQPVGEIAGLQYAMAPDGRTRLPDAAPLLEVTTPAGSEGHHDEEPFLVPFIKAWLDQVDIAQRRVTMHLPEGLLSTEDLPGDEANPE